MGIDSQILNIYITDTGMNVNFLFKDLHLVAFDNMTLHVVRTPINPGSDAMPSKFNVLKSGSTI